MKKILFLLLVTIASYGQTYQNPTFGTVTTKTTPTVTTPAFIGTLEATGVNGKIPSTYIEKTENKATDFTTLNNTLYPSVQAVKTELDLKQNIITDPVTGYGDSGAVAFWQGTSNIGADESFFFDASLKRLGIGGVPAYGDIEILGDSFGTKTFSMFADDGTQGSRFLLQNITSSGNHRVNFTTDSNTSIDPVWSFDKGQFRIGTSTGESLEYNSLLVRSPTPDNPALAGRAINAINTYGGTYASTAIQAQVHVSGSNNQDHDYGVQAWVFGDGTGTVNETAGVMSAFTNNGNTITNHFAFLAKQPTINSGTVTNNYGFFTQGTQTNYLHKLITGSAQPTSSTTPYYMSVYAPYSDGIYGITSPMSAIFSNSTATIGHGGVLALGGNKANGDNSTYPFAYLKGSTQSAANHRSAFEVYTTSGGGDGEVDSGNYIRYFADGESHKFYGKNSAVAVEFSKAGAITATSYTGGATLTGTPTAPTATVGTNTDQVATTAFGFANFIALSGNQTLTGRKTLTSDNTTAGGINVTNSKTTTSTYGDNFGIYVANSGTGGILVNNSSVSNAGIEVANYGGNGVRLNSFATTDPLLILRTQSGTSDLFSAELGKVRITSAGDLRADTFVSNGVIRLKNYTVATLPAGTQGDTAYVTDALAPTYMATVVAGGAVVTPVFYDGVSWKCH